MNDALLTCPTCGRQTGACTHTTEGQVTGSYDALVEQYAGTEYSPVERPEYIKNPIRPQPVDAAPAASPSVSAAAGGAERVHRKIDTDTQVFFYEQEFYVLSNFSAFSLYIFERRFDTAEHAYHFAKFDPKSNLHPDADDIARSIYLSNSAHEAFRVAQDNKSKRHPDWDLMKAEVMGEILRAKVRQHEYVRRKLMETGDRELIEDSWRDDVWGWGPNRDGQNLLGKLWMEIRAELRATPPTPVEYIECDIPF